MELEVSDDEEEGSSSYETIEEEESPTDCELTSDDGAVETQQNGDTVAQDSESTSQQTEEIPSQQSECAPHVILSEDSECPLQAAANCDSVSHSSPSDDDLHKIRKMLRNKFLVKNYMYFILMLTHRNNYDFPL